MTLYSKVRTALMLAGMIGTPYTLSAQTPAYDVTSLNGGFAYTISGSAIDPNSERATQIAEVGRLAADGAGNVSGSDTVMIDGSLVRRTFTGSYAINPDGTGSLILDPSWGPQIHADIVAGQGGRLLKLVLTDSGNTLSGVIESQQAAAQSVPAGGYDTSSLQGGYEYRLGGSAVDFNGNVAPISEVGRLLADGNGNLTGTSTVSINGYVVKRTVTGTYAMNPDGSGTATLFPSWGPPINIDLFVSA